LKGESFELNCLCTLTFVLKYAVNNAEIMTSNYAVLMNNEFERM